MGEYRLYPTVKDYLWGGTKLKQKYGKKTDKAICAESWELSFHKDGLTETEGGKALKDVVTENDLGENCKAFPFFPVLIKFIDAKENLSVQVHPSDEYALKNENSFGKTEMWYIVEAEEGAGIYCGFKEDTDKALFERKLADGTVEELLNFIPVKKGESYFIEAGTLHAIGKGCLICEIQQNSNLTYRVYDYNRKDANGNLRELHTEKALKVINFKKYSPKVFKANDGNGVKTLADCNYFRVREVKTDKEFSYSNGGSFVCVNCVGGKGEIDGKPLKKGDSYFISAGEKFTIRGKTTVLITDIHKKKYYAGLDLGGTFIKGGIVDDNGEIIAKGIIPTGKERHHSEIAKDMANFALDLARQANVNIEGIGIGSPGTIDSENGVVVYTNNIKWENVPLAVEIEKFSKLPCKITNDANAACLGEYSLLKNKYKSMIFITLGTGIGGGVIIDGKLFEGFKSAGAELGHHVIKAGGEKCTCGRRGCFEAYCSTTALIKFAKREIQKHKDTLILTECGGDIDAINGKTIFQAYDKKDALATGLIRRYIKYLAEGIANIVNMFRPEIIIIGGGVSSREDVIIKPLKRYVNKMIYGGNKYAPLVIECAKLQNDAGFVGAVSLFQN